MLTAELEIQLIASLVGACCSTLGCFLLLRKLSLLADAISHAMLLGIAATFILLPNLQALAKIAAAMSGVVLVFCIEGLRKIFAVQEHTSIGLVFPLFFSLGVLLISVYAGNIHLDLDIVILGELAFTPFQRFNFGQISFAQSLVIMLVIFVLVSTFLGVFYKELKLSTFDPSLAKALGFAPYWLQQTLLILVCFTAVGAFEAVGIVLVVAYFVVPAACAVLLTKSLGKMLLCSVSISVGCALLGFHLAIFWDVSIAGLTSSLLGLVFLLVFIFSPKQGLAYQLWGHLHQEMELKVALLLVHLSQHQALQEWSECKAHTLFQHLGWPKEHTEKVIKKAKQDQLVTQEQQNLLLTTKGEIKAQQIAVRSAA